MRRSYLTLIALMLTGSLYAADLNTTVTNQGKEIDALNKKIEKLERYPHNNRLVPYKDIDFLYKVTYGETNYTNGNDTIHFDNVWKYSPWYEGELNTTSNRNISDVKLEAVENKLNLKAKDDVGKDIPFKDRIHNAYITLNYDNWDRDRLQFVVLTNYVYGIDSVVPSIGLEVFPSYKKYVPGEIDFVRRCALYLAVGSSGKIDNGLYSAGLNIEIQDGFGINLGWATYDINSKNNSNFTFGISLGSDLWKKLLGSQP